MKITPAALLFDMDGTLTEARRRIPDDVMAELEKIPNSIRQYLVTVQTLIK